MKKFLIISVSAHILLFVGFFVSNLFSDSFSSSSAHKKPEIMKANLVEAAAIDKLSGEHKKNQTTQRKKLEEAARKRVLKAKQKAREVANQKKLEQKIKADILLKKQKELKAKQKKFAAEKQRKEEMKLEQAKIKQRTDRAKKQAEMNKKKSELAKKQRAEQLKKEADKKKLAGAKLRAEKKRLAAAQRKADEASTRQKGEDNNRRIAKYTALIKRKMYRYWRRPIGSQRLQTTVEISLLPNGFVSNVKIRKSSGSRAFDNSVQDALWSAGELPIPKDSMYAKEWTSEALIMRFSNDS